MARRIREFDWSTTPLGPVFGWPQSLKSAVDLTVANGFGMIVLWGPDLIQIYNDGYRQVMDAQHPAGLGQPTRECWPEVWHINEPIYRRIWAGETVTFEDALYPLVRHGTLEDVWFTLTYSPLRDEAGAVAGVLVTLFETTERIRSEAARLRAQSRQAFMLRLSDALRPLQDPGEVQATACRLVAERLGVERAYYAEVDHTRNLFVVERDHVLAGAASAVGEHPFEVFPQPLMALRSGRPMICDDVETSPVFSDSQRPAYAALGIRAFICVPLIKAGVLVATVTAASAEPQVWPPGAAGDLQEVAERTWEAVERARAETAVREAEARSRQLLEGLAQAVWETNAEGLVVTDSPSWRAYTGQSREEWLGRGWLNAVHPEDREDVARRWAEALEAGREPDSEFRLRTARGEWRWTNGRATPIRDADGAIVKWLGMNIDIHGRRAAEGRQQILLAELQHRTRNMLAVIRSIASRTSETSEDLETFLAHFQGRLAAMARTQTATSRSADVSVDLAELLHDEFLSMAAQENQVDISGPDVRLKGKAAESLSLGLHELATNALKYGALSTSHGRVSVRWKVTGRREKSLQLTWRESGVRMLDLSPTRVGFGRRLLEQALAYELGAETRLEFRPGGLIAEIRMPLDPPA
jgi:PAS domain S-box-containing protein